MDLDGNVLGRHEGITHYTVGQRKGLNLSMGHPVFVTEIRPETNEVVIGNSADVFSDTLRCSRINWMAIDGLHGGEMRVTAKNPLQPQRRSLHHPGGGRGSGGMPV